MECNAVAELLKERNIKAEARGRELVLATAGRLKIEFWCPQEEFPHFGDVEELRKWLSLDSVDVLVVVSYRPYVVVDYVNAMLERAYRWYGLKFDVKLLGLSSVDIEVGLEDVLGRAFVEKPHKLGDGVETDTPCPQCGRDVLRLYRQERFFSRKYRGRAVESIYGCRACGFRARRVELLD